MQAAEIPKLRRALLKWYDANRRDLPWRKTRDPYRIWVSEIMLQQTRVAAALPRYENFLERFRTVHELATARESSVLALWSGLGYYRRARNLHSAAKLIVRERGGEFPRNCEEWQSLPGVGRYTAAAIASITQDEPVAVVDGNVERVLQRVLGGTRVRASHWKSAQRLLDCERPGDFNQAMMELGALVCVPGQPKCADCPLTKFCRTKGRGRWQRRKTRQLKKNVDYVLALRGALVLLVQRDKSESLMPGMWELPRAAPRDEKGKKLFSLKHAITVTEFTVNVVEPTKVPSDGKWVPRSRVARLPLTGLARKILRKSKIIQ